MNRKQSAEQETTDGARRPRRRIAKDLLERGQRLRSRVGVLIGVSLGLVALLTALE
ncbi:MAG: hypothetical protein V7631_2504 [Massilia sp.]|jgi:hypothetical protein